MSRRARDLRARRLLEANPVGNGMETTSRQRQQQGKEGSSGSEFRMPLHYPRYTKADYEKMPEWEIDRLLRQYGLPVIGSVVEKRNFAIGAFLWPSH